MSGFPIDIMLNRKSDAADTIHDEQPIYDDQFCINGMRISERRIKKCIKEHTDIPPRVDIHVIKPNYRPDKYETKEERNKQ